MKQYLNGGGARLVTLQGRPRTRVLTSFEARKRPELMGSISSLVAGIPVVGDVLSEIFGLDDDDDVKKMLQAQLAAEQQRTQTMMMALAIGVPAVAVVSLMIARSGKK